MRSACLAAACAAAALAGPALSQTKPDRYAAHIAPGDPRAPADEARAFHLPPGFEAQLVAAEPDIHKPLNLAFDARGRLWVSETLEYPFAARGRPRDGIKILEDFGPDGRARKVTTFADGLNIPIGVLPLPGPGPQEALSYSIPNVYRLRDSTGTGYADERAVLYGRYGFRDTHGMTSAFTWNLDGWVYACHGYANDSTVKGGDGQGVTMNSGNTYRMRPDGSHLEQYTHGQVNPFGLAIDPLGNLYSADCHSQPIYQLLRGAYYPSFGKPHDGLGFGPEMFTNYQDSTAIAGVVYYAADQFPAEYRDCAFIGDVVTNRLVRFRIEWHGSSPKGVMDYFLKSDDPWFRPVDIKLGPDGALYVADFYNRIIGHYEVPLTHPGRDRERGRVWRIAYTGAGGTPAPRPDFTQASVAELVSDLGHPNLAVRIQATNQLAARGGTEGVARVREFWPEGGRRGVAGDQWQRAHGVWVLERCGALDEATLAAAAHDPFAPVRVQAQRVLSERKDLSLAAHRLAVDGLADPDSRVQRAAADALGRHPDAENVRPLLDLRHAVLADDTHLLHVVRMALRDQFRPAETWARLKPEGWPERDARAVADVALGVPSPEAAAFLLSHLRKDPAEGDALTRAVHHVARHGAPDVLAALVAFARENRPDDLGRQAGLFRAVERGTQERGAKPDEAARAWGVALADRLLASRQPGELQAGVELVGTLRLEDRQAALADLATRPGAPDGARAAALNALAALDVARHAGTLGRVVGDAAAPAALREQAANLLAKANRPEGQDVLLAALPTAPARLQNAIAAALAGSPAGAERLLEAVAAGKASARLLQERAVEVRLADSKLPGVKERVAALTQGQMPADEKVNELLRRRRDGFAAARSDAALGAKLFEKHCAACHQVAGKGARVGPQLDGIGARGVERLLEDTLDPNRNVDQAFRLTILTLKSGQVVDGLLLKEEGEVLVLADRQGKEVRVPKGAVEERATSPLSPMPADFAEQIPEADFYHLLAYLLSLRGGPEASANGGAAAPGR
jgi:putative heme-binding domain-containing protein